MAPKRSVKITAVQKNLTVEDKLPKSRTKKSKQLKRPSIITISVPVTDDKSQLLKEPAEENSLPNVPRRSRRKTENVSESVINSDTTALKDDKSQLPKDSEAIIKPLPLVIKRARSKKLNVSESGINMDTAVLKDDKSQLPKDSEAIIIPLPLVIKRAKSKKVNVSNTGINTNTTVLKGVMDTDRKVDIDTKIALADEVATSQLLNKPVDARVNTAPTPPKKRRSKSDTVSEIFNSPVETTASKSPGRKRSVTPKKASKKHAQTVTTKKNLSNKRKADSTEDKSKVKRGKKPEVVNKDKNKLKIEPSIENTTLKEDITKDIENKFDPKVLKSPMVVIPTQNQKLCRGKKTSNVSQTKASQKCTKLRKKLVKPRTKCSNLPKSKDVYCKSPILHSSSNTKPIENVVKAKDEIRHISRLTPTSSISKLSWTHDISNSSTTTCYTVSFKDFICFDNKMPIIKLKSCQSDINKQLLIPVIEDKPITNNKTSKSDNASFCYQTSLIDSNSVPKMDSVNLSFSSKSSNNGSSQIKDHKIKFNKKDYTQATKNLERALERIDMEFINWLPESDYISSDFNKHKDKLFSILKSEFCALTHCKMLQEITTNFKSNDNFDNQSCTKDKSVEIDSVNVNIVLETNDNIQNNILDATNTCTKTIDSESKEKHVQNRDEIKIIESITNVNKIKKIENEGETANPKTCVSVVDKMTNKDRLLSDSEGNSSESECSSDVGKERRFNPHNSHDDEDALSLFAESITGIESSKLNASATLASKQMEEYIPEPIQKKCISPNYTYYPTKITDNLNMGTAKTFCKKQNADSTSKYREPNITSPICNDTISNSVKEHESNTSTSIYKETTSRAENADIGQVFYEDCKAEEHAPSIVKPPRLLSDMYQLRPKTKQIIFKEICFFNLLQNCIPFKKNRYCRYSHRIPDANEITNILCMLNNELLIKEYMMLRKKDTIMNKYGLCFVKVCAERKLTRILIEMALDFINGPLIEEPLKVTVVEITLMHLNEVELCEFEDLLKIKVIDGRLLCEVFMQIMTSSQNFSRFKSVFLSLTYIMVNNDMTFSLEVTEQILERVCILPFNESLVRALLQIMRLTNSEIFLNSMIVQFEKQISVNSEILEEYVSLKKDLNFGNLSRWVENKFVPVVPITRPAGQQMFQPRAQPLLMLTEKQPLSEMRDGEPLPPSPDTTQLEIMNKTCEDTMVPKITRTISGLTVTPYKHSVGFNPGVSNNKEIIPSPDFKSWRNKRMWNVGSLRQLMRPRLKSPAHRKSNRWQQRRYVTLQGSPTAHQPRGAKY